MTEEEEIEKLANTRLTVGVILAISFRDLNLFLEEAAKRYNAKIIFVKKSLGTLHIEEVTK